MPPKLIFTLALLFPISFWRHLTFSSAHRPPPLSRRVSPALRHVRRRPAAGVWQLLERLRRGDLCRLPLPHFVSCLLCSAPRGDGGHHFLLSGHVFDVVVSLTSALHCRHFQCIAGGCHAGLCDFDVVNAIPCNLNAHWITMTSKELKRCLSLLGKRTKNKHLRCFRSLIIGICVCMLLLFTHLEKVQLNLTAEAWNRFYLFFKCICFGSIKWSYCGVFIC